MNAKPAKMFAEVYYSVSVKGTEITLQRCRDERAAKAYRSMYPGAQAIVKQFANPAETENELVSHYIRRGFSVVVNGGIFVG